MEAGYIVHFFGGQALEKQLRARFKDFELTSTDKSQAKPFDANTFLGQFRLLFDYFRRLIGSLTQISKIETDAVAYAVSDYWFDVWPLLLCRAHRKLMIWHMQAPTLRQILCKSRADVDFFRFASFYYWLSQNLSLWLFHFSVNKHVFCVHPDMVERLLNYGYEDEELSYVSFGIDIEQAVEVPVDGRIYDAVWIGRVHRQKGIGDLMATLLHLSQQFQNFRALLIGNVEKSLRPHIKELGLERNVEFSGFVSEKEKFRLFGSCRLFLMTSRFEGSPRVVGEALACNVPVLAYEVETYRAIFGDFVCYVPCFDLERFKTEAARLVNDMRSGKNHLSKANLKGFTEFHGWHNTNELFIEALN